MRKILDILLEKRTVRHCAIAILLLGSLLVSQSLAQSGAVIPQGGSGHAGQASCVILKRMGPADEVTSKLYSFGIRGKQFQYVEGKLPEGFPFHGRLTDHDVRNLQARGAEVLVLESHYTADDLKQARDDCRGETGKTPNQAEAKPAPSQLAAATTGTPTPALSGTTTTPIAAATELSLSSTPAGADINIDGNFAGQTPSTLSLAAGEHTVQIAKKGFAPWERKIRSSGGTTRILAELEPLSATPASAAPAAVAPHQMNESTTPAESNRQEPTPQLHPAILSNAEGPTTQTTAEGNSSIETNGAVSITSSPDGAEIFVDSIGRGHAPALLKVKPGKHTVQLVLSGYEDLVDEIDVRGGSIVNVTGKMGNVEGGKSRFSNVSTLNDVAVSPQRASIGVFSDGNPNVRHDGVTLTSVSEGGPADQAGIKGGDVILGVHPKSETRS
jgi:PEGA domain